jgi:histone H2A
MSGVLEYLCAEVLDLAFVEMELNKKKTIQPKHLNLAFKKDQELGMLMHHATFTQSSVPVEIHPFHMQGKEKKQHMEAS